MGDTLTSFLKQVGDETVTICINGEVKTITKTEALARKMYLMAMGGVEETIGEDGSIVRIVHEADYRMAKAIREFTEGKPASEAAKESPKGNKAGTFSSMVGKRLSLKLKGKPNVKSTI